jgi:hypothetical protein
VKYQDRVLMGKDIYDVNEYKWYFRALETRDEYFEYYRKRHVYRYHAVPGNSGQLSVFGQRVRRLWWLVLRRRGQRPAPWDRLLPIFTRWLPAPRVLHPYPLARFLATHPRWEPYA